MSNPYFQFKQFTVYHDLCAMKVGTDGVLLGAWADCTQAKTALDIGTGSGLIALMLAQRSGAPIHAIDIDENACEQAKINFENSPFSSLLIVEKAAFQHWETSLRFDLIVSNPPYFSDSLKSPNAQRNFARHNDSLFFADLIGKSLSLMNPGGKLAVILPFDGFGDFHTLALENRLFLCRKTLVSSLPHKPVKRVLLEYSNQEADYKENILLIEQSPKIYSEEYIALTKDFYLFPNI
ncbi:MAG: methyltransferase [Candidatus Symbiothrix sp.]|jgi:tRNA1Val (adenine37-N6)-methyltransferase|nr:methyltransferase [Candidatus Symbiothrix sp.]